MWRFTCLIVKKRYYWKHHYEWSSQSGVTVACVCLSVTSLTIDDIMVVNCTDLTVCFGIETTMIHLPSPLPPPLLHLHLQVNVFVLLSVVCVLLNLAGFILCCQGAQLVSSMTSCRLVRMLYCNILMSSKSLDTFPNPVFMFRLILLRLCIIKLSSLRTWACSYRHYTTMLSNINYVILHQM